VVIPALKKLEFQNFVNRLGKLQTAFGGATAEETAAKVSQALKPVVRSQEPSRGDSGGADVAFFTAEETDSAQGVDEVAIAPQIITTEAQLYELLDILSAQTNPAPPWPGIPRPPRWSQGMPP
jgi:DNA polymerase-1